MDRTVRVTGKAKISVKPDLVRLIITQSRTETEYEDAIRESSIQKKELTDVLQSLGFDRSDLKTEYFNVEAVEESYQTEDKAWKNRLVGYRFVHRMKLEFPVASDKLGQVLFVIAHLAGEPEVSIRYTVSDPEGPKNELLKKAVEDSKVKAEVLSKAAGVSLGAIMSIDYSWDEINLVSRPSDGLMLRKVSSPLAAGSNSIDMDIEADDIDVTDTVTVVWAIRP